VELSLESETENLAQPKQQLPGVAFLDVNLSGFSFVQQWIHCHRAGRMRAMVSPGRSFPFNRSIVHLIYAPRKLNGFKAPILLDSLETFTKASLQTYWLRWA
jgi:hypothetical protein